MWFPDVRKFDRHVAGISTVNLIGPDLSRDFHHGKWPRSLIIRIPDFRRDSRFPEMGNLTTRGLRHSDGLDLFRGFHHGKS
jgi:hypothetical protein